MQILELQAAYDPTLSVFYMILEKQPSGSLDALNEAQQRSFAAMDS